MTGRRPGRPLTPTELDRIDPMPITTAILGTCGFCGHLLWPVTGEVFAHEGEQFIELECSQSPDPEQCTRQEFKISDLFDGPAPWPGDRD